MREIKTILIYSWCRRRRRWIGFHDNRHRCRLNNNKIIIKNDNKWERNVLALLLMSWCWEWVVALAALSDKEKWKLLLDYNFFFSKRKLHFNNRKKVRKNNIPATTRLKRQTQHICLGATRFNQAIAHRSGIQCQRLHQSNWN